MIFIRQENKFPLPHKNTKHKEQGKNIGNCKGKDQVTYKAALLQITHDTLMESLRRESLDRYVANYTRDHRWQHIVLYPGKCSPVINGENKIFLNIANLNNIYNIYSEFWPDRRYLKESYSLRWLNTPLKSQEIISHQQN